MAGSSIATTMQPDAPPGLRCLGRRMHRFDFTPM
jgi:hypothetical protein